MLKKHLVTEGIDKEDELLTWVVFNMDFEDEMICQFNMSSGNDKMLL